MTYTPAEETVHPETSRPRPHPGPGAARRARTRPRRPEAAPRPPALRTAGGNRRLTPRPSRRHRPPPRNRRDAASLRRGHVTGPYRTLAQDVSFGVDQLVEIAIRALSPAVNDTSIALTCV